MTDKYRILSFDGGGVRGLLSAILLDRLNNYKDIAGFVEKTDLFVGTSTGSFIALFLASGKSTKDVVDLYSEENMASVFGEKNGWIFRRLFRPKYKNNNLKTLLQNSFASGLRLNDLPKRVLVPSFWVNDPSENSWTPVFFNNFPNSPTGNTLVVDTAMSSSAAPTFFPSYNGHIDGGVIANNPSVAGLSFAMHSDYGKQSSENIVMLSVGTGTTTERITEDTTNWGGIKWALNLADILFDGASDANAMFCSTILGNGRYSRLNPLEKTSIRLDDYSNMNTLVDLANSVDLSTYAEFIYRQWFE